MEHTDRCVRGDERLRVIDHCVSLHHPYGATLIVFD